MKIYSILSHPNRESLNGHLYDAANAYFQSLGHSVETCDVYASESEILNAAHMMYSDSLNKNTGTISNYLNNWSFNWQNNGQDKLLPTWVETEFERIKQADLLYIQTPVWVYSLPGLLKIYIEQAFVYDKFVKLERPWTPNEFKITKLLSGKRVLFGMTTGGSKEMVDHVMGGDGKLIQPIKSQFEFLGFEFLDPYILWATNRNFDKDHEFYIDDFKTYLQNNFK